MLMMVIKIFYHDDAPVTGLPGNYWGGYLKRGLKKKIIMKLIHMEAIK